MFNKDFYPTPEALAHRMMSKVQFNKVTNILEPSAGKGDLIKALSTYKCNISGNSYYPGRYNRFDIFAIEIEPDLRAILMDHDKIQVIDDDFLSYEGATNFDLILANFPFSNGDQHLKKALDIMFCGQIVCLINAETIKNPYTNDRKVLINRLNKLNADIEYISNAFVDAERPTGVEVALVYVNIQRNVETDIFNGMSDDSIQKLDGLESQHEVATKNTYADLVASYKQTSDQVSRQLVDFYRNYHNVGKYLFLKIGQYNDDQYPRSDKLELTKKMQLQHNDFIKILKKDYWHKVTALPEVKKYLTQNQLQKMNANHDKYLCKEFTESNIRQFVLNLVDSFPQHINAAIDDLFQKFTAYALRDSRWGAEEFKANIHYFNAWKTNDGYKVNKKVILPFKTEESYDGKLRISYCMCGFLEDVEKVMRYFKPSQNDGITIADICKIELELGRNRKIETEYFYVSIFKKGTVHLEFRDLELLRRFNIEACKQKAFLPMDYAETDFADLTPEAQDIVRHFEGKQNYTPVKNSLKVPNASQLPLLEQSA